MTIALLVTMTVRAPIGGREDPLPSHMFLVEIDGIAQASFREVSGLRCETEMIEYRDGSDPNTVRLLPGLTRCGPIVLRSGLTTSTELWNWVKQIHDGMTPVPRKNGSVIIMDQSRTERARYNFYNAWPVSYELPPLDASSTGVLLESLELAVERIERG